MVHERSWRLEKNPTDSNPSLKLENPTQMGTQCRKDCENDDSQAAPLSQFEHVKKQRKKTCRLMPSGGNISPISLTMIGKLAVSA